MSNPDPTPPRRGRAPVHRHQGQGSSSGHGGSPVPPGQEPPPAPLPAGLGIASDIPHEVQPGVGGSSSGTVDPSVGGGGPMAVLQIGGASGTSTGSGVVQRKRAREGDAEAGPSRSVRQGPPYPSPPLPPPPPPVGAPQPQGAVEGQGQFYCSTCVRYFDSDRGLCGHLRTHADRGYRGAFPPPVFTRQEFVDEGVEHLLNPLDGGQVDPMAAAGGGGVAGAPNAGQNTEAAPMEATGGAAARIDIDLNVPAQRDDNDGDFI